MDEEEDDGDHDPEDGEGDEDAAEGFPEGVEGHAVASLPSETYSIVEISSTASS